MRCASSDSTAVMCYASNSKYVMTIDNSRTRCALRVLCPLGLSLRLFYKEVALQAELYVHLRKTVVHEQLFHLLIILPSRHAVIHDYSGIHDFNGTYTKEVASATVPLIQESPTSAPQCPTVSRRPHFHTSISFNRRTTTL